jgi:hypothetical protein
MNARNLKLRKRKQRRKKLRWWIYPRLGLL